MGNYCRCERCGKDIDWGLICIECADKYKDEIAKEASKYCKRCSRLLSSKKECLNPNCPLSKLYDTPISPENNSNWSDNAALAKRVDRTQKWRNENGT